MSSDALVKIVLSVLVTISLAIAGWGLGKVQSMSEDMKLLKYQLGEISTNNADDIKQNETLSKHWRYLGWTRDQINTLRHGDGLDPVSWPSD